MVEYSIFSVTSWKILKLDYINKYLNMYLAKHPRRYEQKVTQGQF